jgi:hypothetical protein
LLKILEPVRAPAPTKNASPARRRDPLAVDDDVGGAAMHQVQLVLGMGLLPVAPVQDWPRAGTP